MNTRLISFLSSSRRWQNALSIFRTKLQIQDVITPKTSNFLHLPSSHDAAGYSFGGGRSKIQIEIFRGVLDLAIGTFYAGFKVLSPFYAQILINSIGRIRLLQIVSGDNKSRSRGVRPSHPDRSSRRK